MIFMNYPWKLTRFLHFKNFRGVGRAFAGFPAPQHFGAIKSSIHGPINGEMDRLGQAFNSAPRNWPNGMNPIAGTHKTRGGSLQFHHLNLTFCIRFAENII
jgi:hypothetical protein